jgi:ATP-dependent Clp protease ATP-binding subunit ClpC
MSWEFFEHVRALHRARQANPVLRQYESSQLGDMTIDTEHILLGLLREGKGLTSRVLQPAQIRFTEVRAKLEAARGHRQRVPTSVEIPFTERAKQALMYRDLEALKRLFG